MTEDRAPETLTADETARVVEFARACRAATRAVSLYPTEHPAIVSAVARLADMCVRSVAPAGWALGISPDSIVLDGRRLSRSDVAVGELAGMLHAHRVGELVVRHGTGKEAWLKLLRLLALPAEEMRSQGGISRVWATTGVTGLEITELDYAAVLREGQAGGSSWEEIIRDCLQGRSIDFDARVVEMLAEIFGDPERAADFASQLENASGAEAAGGKPRAYATPATILLSMLRRVLDTVGARDPEKVEPILGNMALAVSRLSPDTILELVAARKQQAAEGDANLADRVLERLTDNHVATFVANSVVASRGATARLAAAFLALVPEPEHRASVLAAATEMMPPTEAGGLDASTLQQRIEALLGSYTDEAYVSTDYANDLATARARAQEMDVIADDPPERIAAWLSTVTDQEVRACDLRLLLDLLALETDPARWREIADLAVVHVEDLLLIGDFRAAAELVRGLAATAAETEHQSVEAGLETSVSVSRSSAASAALGRLTSRQILAHVVQHLNSADAEDFACLKEICLSIGPAVIQPLAELLAAQERAAARTHLKNLLLAFGALGRQSVEQLKQSPNASVRRVAVYLLREFGGTEALPDLETLLDDAEPHVQREAVRAILLIGSDDAYSVLDRALRSGSARSRDAILRLLDRAGDERAAPLFAYIVRRGDYRKALRDVYLKAVAALGRLGGDEAVDALKEGLYRGEWWAPLRTASLRAAAARSLHAIGSPRALYVLQEASERGPRGVRAAARPQLRGRP